ncbi:protein of unknown function [Serratia sp. Tan611]|nr:protein of unknown function [Serratia sp. Tan611]
MEEKNKPLPSRFAFVAQSVKKIFESLGGKKLLLCGGVIPLRLQRRPQPQRFM